MQTAGQHANDFESIVPALRRAREKLGATHVLFGPQRGARARSVTVFSPHSGGYVKRKLYANSGLYHWPAAGHVVAKLPRGVESIDGYTEGSIVKENPVRAAEPRLDAFTRAYLDTALWSSTDGDEPLDKTKDISDIANVTLYQMKRDSKLFQERYGSLLTENDAARAGHDFWLTRNGHGAGFWDGDWPVHGEALTKASKSFGSFELYVGDDGKIYASGYEEVNETRRAGELEYGEALRQIEQWAKRQGWKFDTAVPLEDGWWDVTVRKRVGARAEVVRVHEGELESPRGGEPLRSEEAPPAGTHDYVVHTEWTDNEGTTFVRKHLRRGSSPEEAKKHEREHNEQRMRDGMRADGWSYKIVGFDKMLPSDDPAKWLRDNPQGGEPLLGAGEKYRGATIVKTRTGWYTPTYGYGSPTKERLKELIDQSADWVQKSGWKASEPALAEEKYRGAMVQKTKRGYYTPTYGYGAGTKAELKAFIDQSVEWIERSGWKADSPQGGEPGGEPLLASDVRNGTVVVTRHKALAKYLVEQGIISADANVIEHATADDVRGKHVIGVLPLPLAALAASVTEVPLDIPADLRGKELTLAQVRQYARAPQLFRCEGVNKCEVCGHILDAAGLNKWGNPNCAGGRPHRTRTEFFGQESSAKSPQGGEPGGEPLGGAKEPPKIEAHRTVLPWGGDGWAVDLDFIREGLRTYGTTRKEAIEKAVRDIQAWKRGAWRRRARENSPQGGEPWHCVPATVGEGDRSLAASEGDDAVPWVRITRDPKLYEEGIKRAKEIGPIDGGRQIYDLLSPALSEENQEVFLVVLCNLRQECIGVAEVHRGERSRVSVSRADILQVVTKSGADHFHVVHNHPSGDPTPSEADRKLTEAIQDGAVEVEIPCVDHVVIGMGKFYSFAEGKVTKVR